MQRQQRLGREAAAEGLPEDEEKEHDAADDERGDGVGVVPGVDLAAPGEAEQEDKEAAAEEHDAEEVEVAQLLAHGAGGELLFEGRREVEEDKEKA